jgi:hypothetical protein
MSFIKKIFEAVKPVLKLGNSLNEIRLGFEPDLNRAANFAEGYVYKYRSNTYTVVENRWVLL